MSRHTRHKAIKGHEGKFISKGLCGAQTGYFLYAWDEVTCESCLNHTNYSIQGEMIFLQAIVESAQAWVDSVDRPSADSPCGHLKMALENLKKYKTESRIIE